MFFIISIISMLGYAVQATLMAGIYRKMDAQEALSIRGLCLMVSMSPLLFWVPKEAFAAIPQSYGWIVLAALLGSLGGWIGNRSFRFLPVGITTTFMAVFNTLMLCLLGFLIFRESISPIQLMIILFILVCVVMLGLTKSAVGLSQVGAMRKGILFCAGFGVCVSFAFISVSHVSRTLNPLLAAYLWESTIGIVSLTITIIRKSIQHQPVFSATPKHILSIFFSSSPTVIGSGGYMIAVTKGPVSLVAAIGSTLIVVTTILARFIYKEKISTRQWLLLITVCLLIILLRTVT